MQRLLAGVVHVPGRSALDLGGGKGKMEGADWFGFFDRIERISEFGIGRERDSAVADRRYRKKGTGLVAAVPFEKRDGRD